MHPWHDLSLGEDAPRRATAVVEIPMGSRVKYELDLKTGLIKADRILRGAEVYPANYGFFPRTLSTDDDPLDAMVLASEPLVPLTVAEVVPIGLLHTSSKTGQEAKILSVLDGDAAFERVRDVRGLPEGLYDKLLAFIHSYKTLEGEPVRVLAERGVAAAHAAVREAARRYERRLGRPAEG